MPKDRPNKKIVRNNPLVGQSATTPTYNQNAEKIPEILKKLSSESSEEKEIACSSIANIVVVDSATTLAVMQRHPVIVEKLIVCLIHDEIGVQLAACGALRNAVLTGGFEFCQQLVDLNCVTPLIKTMEKNFAADALDSGSSATPEQRQTIQQLFAEQLELLSSLLEFYDEQLVYQSKSFTTSLLKLSAMTSVSRELRLSLYKYFNTILDENEQYTQFLLSIESDLPAHWSKQLQAFIESNDYLNAITMSSILYSMTSVLGDRTMLLDLLSVVAPLIETILKIDIFQPFTAIATTLQTKLAAKQQATNDDVDISVLELTSMSLSSTQRQQLSAWKDASSALRAALELWNNILVDLGELVENMDQLNRKEQSLLASLGERFKTITAVALLRCNIPPAIGALLADCPTLRAPLLNLHIGNFALIQRRAIHCIANTLCVVPLSDIGREPQRLWDYMCKQASNGAAIATEQHVQENAGLASLLTSDDGALLVEAAGSALWALLRAEAASENMCIVPSNDQLNSLIAMLTCSYPSLENQHSTEDDFESASTLRINLVGTLGALGARALPSPAAASNLASCIVACVDRHSQRSLLIAELLNAVFDCFAIDDFNQQLSESGLLDSLQRSLPLLHEMIKAAELQSEDEQLIGRLMETAENVEAFLAYKANQQ